MIEQNVELKQININVFDIRIVSSDLQALFKQCGGLVHVKVSKPQNKGTEAQNKAMHKLLQLYYASRMHSCPEPCWPAKFKEYMKRVHGPIPYFWDFEGVKEISLKSWANYTKKERHDFIDGLISEIHQSGAYTESAKIREIIDGMEL